MAKLLYLFLITALIGIVLAEETISENNTDDPDFDKDDDDADVDTLDDRILGGKLADPEQYPFQVSLQSRPSAKRLMKLCGGVIIAVNWVLTAAHCVLNDPSQGKALYINAGVTYVYNYDRKVSQFIKVAKVHVHPDFDTKLKVSPNDIALLELGSALTLKPRVQAIALPPSADFNVEREGIIMGYGATGFPTPEHQTDNLMYAPINITVEDCALIFENITSSQICLGGKLSETAACQGDSGSPFVVTENDNYVLAGIASFGSPDCGRAPTIYTKVSSFLDWIKKVSNVEPVADYDE